MAWLCQSSTPSKSRSLQHWMLVVSLDNTCGTTETRPLIVHSIEYQRGDWLLLFAVRMGTAVLAALCLAIREAADVYRVPACTLCQYHGLFASVLLPQLTPTQAVSVWSPYARGNGQWIARNIVIGFVAAPIEALPETSITDLFFAHERGTYMGWYAWFLASSNFFAPVITGFINDGLGYRWCFFIQAIFCGVASVFLFFFLEETNYDRKTVGSVEGTRSPLQVDTEAAERTSDTKPGPEKDTAENSPVTPIAGTNTPFKRKTYLQKLALWDKPRPFVMHWRAWQILKLLSWPVIFYAGFSYGTYLVWFNILNATTSIILGGAPYNFTPAIVGLSYIACILGVTVAALLTGVFSDWVRLSAPPMTSPASFFLFQA